MPEDVWGEGTQRYFWNLGVFCSDFLRVEVQEGTFLLLFVSGRGSRSHPIKGISLMGPPREQSMTGPWQMIW